MPTPKISTGFTPEPECFADAVAIYYKDFLTPEVEVNQYIEIDIEACEKVSSKAKNKQNEPKNEPIFPKNERIEQNEQQTETIKPKSTKSTKIPREARKTTAKNFQKKDAQKRDFGTECYQLFYVYIKQAKQNLKKLILEFDTQLKNGEKNLRDGERSMHCLLYVYRIIFAFIDNKENLEFHLNELGWSSDETYLFDSVVDADNIEMFMESREWIIKRMKKIFNSPQEWISVDKMKKILSFMAKHSQEFDEYDSLVSQGHINMDVNLLLEFVELNLVYLHEIQNLEIQEYGKKGYWVNAYFYDFKAAEAPKKKSTLTKLNKLAEMKKQQIEEARNKAALVDHIMKQFNKGCQEDTIEPVQILVKSSTLDMAWTPESTPKSAA